MRAGAGKAKGSAFERKIAKELSLWITGGADDKQLIRSVLSGGWRAGRATSKEGWRQVGDLAPNGETGNLFREKFAVECKHRRSIDLYGLWTKQTDIIEWWEKLRTEIAEAHKDTGVAPTPLMIFRSNGRPIMVGTTVATAQWLRIGNVMVVKWLNLAIFPFQSLLRCSPQRVLSDVIEP